MQFSENQNEGNVWQRREKREGEKKNREADAEKRKTVQYCVLCLLQDQWAS